MRFKGFVILGSMRTGSNYLQEVLNTLPGVFCHGEAFNPFFVGGPKKTEVLGLTKAERDADPLRLLNAIWAADGLHGFRYFNDHDPRVFDAVLNDRRIAKIVLTRRPIDSYVSLKIAKATKIWKQSHPSAMRDVKVAFDETEYLEFVSNVSGFYQSVRDSLQRSGQAAYWLDYDDLKKDGVLAGLAGFLGQSAAPDATQVSMTVQNPLPLAELLENPEAVQEALARAGETELTAFRHFEPGRGPAVQGYVATESGLLYMPIPGAARDPISDGLEGERHMRQRDVRRWMRQHRGHRAITVVRDPLCRAYDAFTNAILRSDSSIGRVREAIRRDFGVQVPDDGGVADYTLTSHQNAFAAFLDFLEANLTGQTQLPVQRVWASQHGFVAAMAGLRPPDRILRYDQLAGASKDFPELGKVSVDETATPFSFEETVTSRHRELAFRAYRKDYLTFGF